MDSLRTRLNLTTVLGFVFALIGLSDAWFSVNTFTQKGQSVILKFSPFVRVIFVKSEPTVSQFFYKLDASFVGGAIIFGALSSIIGNYFDKEKASIFGGIIILISTFLFPSTLPVEIPLGRALSIKRGFIISVISAFLIFISYFFYIDLNVILKRIRGINFNKKNLKILSKIDPKKYVYSVIEIIGISGGIYTSYELYRLIRKVTYVGSITLTTGEVPLFLYRIELFICLYTILFLSFYLLNKYVLKSIFK